MATELNSCAEEKTSFFKNIRTYFREYCTCTSVHGLHYFAEKDRTIFERIWWFSVFTFCLVACIFSFFNIYTKWDQHSISVYPANQETSLFTIPFPAVTICHQSIFGKNKPNYDALLRDIKVFKETGNISETPEFQFMSLMCNSPPLNFIQSGNVNRVKKFTTDFLDIMDKLKPDLHLAECSYNLVIGTCKELFTPTITHEGICYTFNIANRSEIFKKNVFLYKDYYVKNTKSTTWSIDSGYRERASLKSYPFRIFSSGAENSLKLKILASDDDLDYGCKSSELGYKIFLHTPINIPDLNQDYFWLPLNQSVVATVKPVMTTTTNPVRKYSPEKRKCYFQKERHLQYFQYYTSANCKMECRANYTLYLCDCVPFFMPREEGTEICTNKTCMENVDFIMMSDQIWKELKISQSEPSSNIMFLMKYKMFLLKSRNKTFQTMDCDCLPSCTELNYEADTSQTDVDVRRWFHSGRSSVDFKKPHVSSLTIFFKSQPFIKTVRQESYGSIDFLANFGGLLGLFSGFSVVSLIEMIYFMTLRILCNQYLFGRWAGQK